MLLKNSHLIKQLDLYSNSVKNIHLITKLFLRALEEIKLNTAYKITPYAP